jgi:hypothetical protein
MLSICLPGCSFALRAALKERRPADGSALATRPGLVHACAMDAAFERAMRLVEAFVFASAEPVAASAVARLVMMPYSAHEVLTGS